MRLIKAWKSAGRGVFLINVASITAFQSGSFLALQGVYHANRCGVSKALAGRYRTIMLPRLSNVLMVWLGKLARRMIKHRLAGLLQA
jgi:hypothetical protein